jgi:ankyrin repeat protein
MSKRDADGDWFQKEQLHIAAQNGDVDRVRALLAENPSLAYFDAIGCTPLHYAVEKEDFRITSLLLESGADINAHDREHIGETPLGRVADTCTPEMARFLVERGADPTIPGWMTLTAIDRAQQRKDEDGPVVVEILKKRRVLHGA